MLQIILVVGLALHIVAVCIWLTLYRHLERWVWWLIFIGFMVLGFHRVDEVLHYGFFPYSSHVTAALIALIIIIAVLQARRWATKRARLQKQLVTVHEQLKILAKEVVNRPPIADQVAKILASLRSEIDYYESAARKHGWPLYKDILGKDE